MISVLDKENVLYLVFAVQDLETCDSGLAEHVLAL